ncbi:MAG: hypothetical protein QOJ09_1885 [Actinomycetota bacterium]|nr:hypothetical protein [Actinomycetota bacterium]
MPGGRPSNPTLVGRVAELGALQARFVALTDRGATTVLVAGEAGIGKSRLIEEFRDRAREAGALVAVGVCTPADGGGLPYGPVVGMLRDLARQLAPHDAAELVEPVQRDLGLHVAPAGRGEPAPVGRFMAVGMAKTALFESMLRTVKSLADRAPTVLVFEDLQWADSGSVEMIDFLTRNVEAHPVLLICTYRTDEVDGGLAAHRLFAELGRHPRVTHVELGGLDRNEIAEFLRGVLDERPDWALVDAVFNRSQGNPFFAEELAAARHATTLPRALRNVVMMRIDQLSADGRHVVAIAAASGAPIQPGLLSAVAEVEGARLDAAVAEAVERKVLVVTPGASTLEFRHALVAEVAHEAVLPGERARLHRRLAEALTAQPGLGAEGPGHAAVELARHWWEAGEWPAAFHTSISAALAAGELLIMPEAHVHFERAIAAARHASEDVTPGDLDWGELLVRASDAAYITGETARSIELAQQALTHLDVEGDAARAAACYTMLARNAWAAGQHDLVFDSFTRAKSLLPSSPPSAALAGVLAEEARVLMLSAHYQDAITRCEEAIDVAREVGDRITEGHAGNTLGVCLVEQGDTDRGIALVREALAIAEELAHPDQISRAYANLTHVLSQVGRTEEAAAVTLDGVARGGSFVDVRLNSAGQNSAEALLRLGRWDEAEELLSRLSDRGAGSCQYGFYAVNSLPALRRGRFDEADRLLATAEGLAIGRNTLQERGWIHQLRAELCLEQDEPAAAMREIDQALTIGAGTDDEDIRAEVVALGLRALADTARASSATRRRIDEDKQQRLARGFVEDAEGFARGYVERGWAPNPRLEALAALCRAEESRLLEPDGELWFAAASAWDACREPYPAAYCRWRAAEALLATKSERGRAIEAVHAAWRVGSSLGARPLQARVERLAERARIPLPESAEPPTLSPAQAAAEDLGLTPREVEVLTQLTRGRTDREIADELFISKKTASVHVSNLLRKLDVGNRMEAAAIGQRARLA